MPRLLIIAIGNPLRCDDGLAWFAAEALSRDENAPEILCVHQLTPEIAEELSRAGTVIFVDAACEGGPGNLICRNLAQAGADACFSHYFTPATIRALAETLYGARPAAFSVTMTGECFDHGDTLSPSVVEGMPHLLAKIRALLR